MRIIGIVLILLALFELGMDMANLTTGWESILPLLQSPKVKFGFDLALLVTGIVCFAAGHSSRKHNKRSRS